MNNIADNINKVMRLIKISAKSCTNFDTSPKLLAVSKGQPICAINEAYQQGIRDFGENYLSEAMEKITELHDHKDINWHFLGPIQSNKTRAIAENFHWVHSVDRLKTAQRLSDQRPTHLPPLQICLQVNIDNDPNKSGLKPEDAEGLALKICKLPKLSLRGLMTIPKKNWQQSNNNPYKNLHTLFDQLRTSTPQLSHMDTLSMGMSNDYQAAIEQGATLVRVGTEIFGPRQMPPA